MEYRVLFSRSRASKENDTMTSENGGIMDLLKDATSEQHRDAESRKLQKEMGSGHLTSEKYGAWLGQMFLLHRSLRQEIDRHGGAWPALASVVRDEGLHVANLRADLTALGSNAERVAALPSTAGAIEAICQASDADPLTLLGFNYVLEGSMNGNRFIARSLAQTLHVSAFSYLNPYGEEQRPTWAAYRERMNAEEFDAGQTEHMVRAAQRMFTYIGEMSDELVDDPVPASR